MNFQERIHHIQSLLKQEGLDGWLFAGYHHPDPVLAAVLRVDPPARATRRYAYFIPVDQDPVKLLHAMEPHSLEGLSGTTWTYHNRQQWDQATASLVEGHPRIAMQYSPRGALPSVDALPAGWLELLRAHGAQPASSSSLLAAMATLSPDEISAHEAAARALTGAIQGTFASIREAANQGKEITELSVQASLSKLILDAGLELLDAPIVAFGEHTADPHYVPTKTTASPLLLQDLVLIDAWARSRGAAAVFADITWMAVYDEAPSHEFEQLFTIVCRARDQGFSLVERSAKEKRALQGAHVDELVRGLLEADGYLDYFLHRTGHSLGLDVHGMGTNLDSLETYDERPLLPGSVFTIEPGVYLPGRYGMRTEINVAFLDGEARITTQPVQQSLLAILG